jgi:RimJ/RimL family protein N-acetyltransferase
MCRTVTARLPRLVSDGAFVLRLWEPEDAEMLHRSILVNLEHLRPFMAWVSFEPLTVEQRRELIVEWRAQWEQGGEAPMAMLDDGEMVGGTGYVRRPGATALEVGYWVDVGHVGRGYATRATAMLTTAVFAAGLVPELEVHHDKANVRSGRIPPRLGFSFIGEQPDEKVAPGEVGIDCTWRMTGTAWQSSGHRDPSLHWT